MNNLLLIDGSSLLSESYYGTLPDAIKFLKDKSQESAYYHLILHNIKGVYTNGVYTFMKRLENILEEQKPTHLAVTFDVSRDTFRKKLYPEYKANRSETPLPLRQQKETLMRLLQDIGVKVYFSTEYEGDDLLGSLAERFKKEALVTLYSADHDLTQLVGPGVRYWLSCKSTSKAEEMYLDYTQGNNGVLNNLHLPDKCIPLGVDSTKWLMGVTPDLVASLKAIAGDTSDNYPGIKGISEKTAAILLSHFGSIDKLFETVLNTDEKELKEIWKKIGLRSNSIKLLKTEGAYEAVKDFLKLSTIVTNIPIPFSLDTLAIKINPIARKEWYQELEFRSLLQRDK